MALELIANGTVGRVALADATPSVAVRNPDDTYGELVGGWCTM